uniref:Uncharacterized protein n=1 Tax=Ovis aries TaxID=9940 RepID=A0AC11EF92_SHEEP
MNHRVPAHKRYQPTEYEHAANCATHALWIIPSILGSSNLYFLSDDDWEAISAWIYGLGLCGLFVVSTVFHTISWKKSHLRTVEHCLHMSDRMVIYFFIAASYAPWLNLRELGPGPPTCDGWSGSWPRSAQSMSSSFMSGTSSWSCSAMSSWASSPPWWSFPCLTPRASGSWWLEGSSTAWAWCSSRATGGSPLPMPSGISLWHSVLAPTTMPSGGTCICPAPCRPGCPSEAAQPAWGHVGLWSRASRGVFLQP